MKQTQEEITVLKDTVQKTQMQLRSKESDNQRLKIKIKRLDKEAEMNQSSQLASSGINNILKQRLDTSSCERDEFNASDELEPPSLKQINKSTQRVA